MPQMKQSKISTVAFSPLWLIYIEGVNNSDTLVSQCLDWCWLVWKHIFSCFYFGGRVMPFNHRSDMWTPSLWPVLSHLWEWHRSSFQRRVQYRSLHLGTCCCFCCHSREQALLGGANELPQGHWRFWLEILLDNPLYFEARSSLMEKSFFLISVQLANKEFMNSKWYSE